MTGGDVRYSDETAGYGLIFIIPVDVVLFGRCIVVSAERNAHGKSPDRKLFIHGDHGFDRKLSVYHSRCINCRISFDRIGKKGKIQAFFVPEIHFVTEKCIFRPAVFEDLRIDGDGLKKTVMIHIEMHALIRIKNK